MLDTSLVLDEVFNINVFFSIRHRFDAHNIAVWFNLAIVSWHLVILLLVVIRPVFTANIFILRTLSAVIPNLTFLLCCLVFGKEIPQRRVS